MLRVPAVRAETFLDSLAEPVEELARPIYTKPLAQWGFAAVVLGVDYACGPVVHFPIFFVLPVTLAAWAGNTRTAYALAIVQPLVRFLFRFLWPHTPWSTTVSAINFMIRVTVLVLITYLVARTRRQTRALAREVRMLQGILPTCAYCKKIRDENNQWRQMEAYIAEHSQADFSHGICPECAQQHFGKILQGNV